MEVLRLFLVDVHVLLGRDVQGRDCDEILVMGGVLGRGELVSGVLSLYELVSGVRRLYVLGSDELPGGEL